MRASRSGMGQTRNGPGLCVRSTDPTVIENLPFGPPNPPYGNSGLPIGCVSNSRIVNMPAAYSVSATAAYPSVDAFLTGANQNVVNGPYSYGKYLVITTDFPSGNANLLTENGAIDGKPFAGSLSAWVCIDSGPGNSGANQDR